MQSTARKLVSRDQMLDYLFQEPIEEQFEALRVSQERSEERPVKRSGFGQFFGQWFRGSESAN